MLENIKEKHHKRQPWLVRDIFYLYLLTVIFLICGLSVGPLITGVAVEKLSIAYMAVMLLFLNIFILCSIVFLVVRIYGANIREVGLTVNHFKKNLIYGFSRGVLLLVVLYCLAAVGLGDRSPTAEAIGLDIGSGLLSNIAVLINIILVTSVVEVVVFIGYFYTILSKRYRKDIAIILISLIFSFTMALPTLSIAVIIPSLIKTFVLVKLYEHTKSLVAPITATFLLNTTNLIVVSYFNDWSSYII